MFTCGPAFFSEPAGGGGGSGHRYWRIRFHTTNDTGFGTCDITEVELHTSIGGADVTGSGTASASYNNGTAGQAFDNNTSSSWSIASGNYPADLVYDFGAGNEKDIVEFSIYVAGPASPRKFDFEWSDDNSAWTPLYSIAGEAGWNTATRTFSASTDPDLYRYWRLYVTATNGHAYVSQQTIKMRESISGSDIAAGNGTAIGNDNQFTLEPYRAFDSNNGTVWATNSLPGYCGKDFGASNTGWRTVVEWVLRADVATQAPKTFKMQKSHDTSSWVDVITPADQTGWSVGEERTFS